MNYPEDIRQYDNNQKSPRYDNSHDAAIKQKTHEIAKEMIEPDGYDCNGVNYNIDDVMQRIASNLTVQYGFQKLLTEVIAGEKDISELRDLLLENAGFEAEIIAEKELSND